MCCIELRYFRRDSFVFLIKWFNFDLFHLLVALKILDSFEEFTHQLILLFYYINPSISRIPCGVFPIEIARFFGRIPRWISITTIVILEKLHFFTVF